MGSYGSQSVASIGDLMAREAELKAAKAKKEKEEEEEYLIAVFLPKDLIKREANKSPELIDDDLKTIHEACVKAWSRIEESD
jgi:hypothetical protein